MTITPRFSLRCVALLVTVCALAGAYGSHRLQLVKSCRQSILHLQAENVSLEVLETRASFLPRSLARPVIIGADLCCGVTLNDDIIRRVALCESLETLVLPTDDYIGDRNLEPFGACASLTTVEHLPIEWIHLVESWPKLRRLKAWIRSTSNADKERLLDPIAVGAINSCKNLEELRVRVVDDDLRQINDMRAIRTLDLVGSPINGSGFAGASLPSLRRLKLRGTQLNDVNMAFFADLPLLNELDIGWTNVTDAGLELLEECEHLEVLSVDGTAVTGDGLISSEAVKQLRVLVVDERQAADVNLGITNGGKLNLRVVKNYGELR